MQIYLLMVVSHSQYLKLQETIEIFLKLCPTVVINVLSMKILIFSCALIWVIFQNSVTNVLC